jgi:aspartokinase/homoserine dehydrogenase 1
VKVLKFGGTSVANSENIRRVIDIVKNKQEQVVIVVSALGGITNTITRCAELASKRNPEYQILISEIEAKHIEAAKELITNGKLQEVKNIVKELIKELNDICHGVYLLQEISPKTKDYLLGFGERMSALIISEAFNSMGINTMYIDARELIVTDENFGNANVDFDASYDQINDKLLGISDNIIVNGFIATSKFRNQTTLGRGGSDYTAAILANALNANILEIWTDVSGVMTADPNLVSSAFPLKQLSYEEAMELSHFGAKVIYPPTIQPVLQKGIPILIKNTFRPDENGTLISKETNKLSNPVKGLSHINNAALLTLTGSGMVGATGTLSRLFSTLYANKINIMFVTLASSEHTVTVGIDSKDTALALDALNVEFASEMKLGKINDILVEDELSIVALVGDNMKESVGLSGKTFHSLGSNGINVRAIAQGSTERNISIVIKRGDVKKALNVLHESFFLSEVKKMHLFIVGAGNVGQKLLQQVEEQKEYLKKEFKLEIRVAALANSRKMLFNHEYIGDWHDELMEKGEKTDMKKFISKIRDLNMRNSVFVDNTANGNIAKIYGDVLDESISVVASNKIAASSEYSNYKYLNDLATKRNVKYLYETNVAAGLPVLRTIRSMIKSGDKIHKIEAVLSGSLNFIFNNFNDENSFAKTVEMAMEEGYTEPDPRIDLSGTDVMRKILILARESGSKLEFDEISNEGFIPQELFKKENTDEFLKALKENSSHFEAIRKKAESEGKKLRFTAVYENGKAKVGLQSVGKESPYYQLDGKDNIVLIYSKRYSEQPLIVKGAGAGAEVTASGVFADIMSIANE